MCNIAVVSVHTSPLARPGTRDSGGMNVYIRELSRQLCRRAHSLDIFTRRTDPDTPQVTEIDGRTRVIQVDAGPPDAEKGSLQRYLPEFRCGVIRFQEAQGRSYDLVHSHYWLSGWVGQALKARWNVPHVIMFHTLGEAKNRSHLSEREPDDRIAGERLVAQGADRVICAREGGRRTRLLVVGGDGKDAERKEELRRLAQELGIAGNVIFQDAVSHDRLPLYYNAADVCVVPSYYESFGLVALEAMACGVPVVASRVGGLLETVQDGRTGYLVPWRCPEPFAERLELLLANEPLRRRLGRLARSAVERFRWTEVATRVENVYHELVSQYRGVDVGAHVA